MNKLLLSLVLLLSAGCIAEHGLRGDRWELKNGRWVFVYWHGGSYHWEVAEVEGVDQSSLEPLNNQQYAKDSKRVYWRANVIKGADPNTFECLGHLYGKDKAKVFWRLEEIKGADSESFQIIDGPNLWSKDKKDVYFGYSPLGVQDLTSFTIINNGYSRDSIAYYATPQFVQVGKVDCDYPTMKILSDHYAVDKNRAYHQRNPIEGVDVATFRATSFFTAEDQYRKYRFNEVDKTR